MGTAIVVLIIGTAIGAVIKKLIKDKKAGKSLQCGGDCTHCGGGCHS